LAKALYGWAMSTTQEPAGAGRPPAVNADRARETSTPPRRSTSTRRAVARASACPAGTTKAKGSFRIVARRFTAWNMRSQ